MVFGALISALGKTRALDIGAGTGVLSLMALQQNPNLQIDAIEIHDAAARECSLNVKTRRGHHLLLFIPWTFSPFSLQKRMT